MLDNNSDDISLMGEVSKGSVAAFNTIYARYSEAVYYTIYKKIKDKTEVDDVFQEFFASVWRKRATIVVNTSFKAWLFTSVRNHVLNHLLQVARKEKNQLAYNEGFSEADHEFEGKMDVTGLPELINGEIERLPEKMRLVWQLRKEKDMSIAEISAHLNSSEQTVKNQLTSANKRLRLFLSKLHTFLFLL
ncbi:RNA polymerase sigma factor [Pseudopedobacter beijingensis]|uniref:RNA polymerase sigma factor n=1 Tax=Pseudopedobacter beijingensis TaxID=1207056 RepID=A0ABW4ICK4_9SPHI